MRTVACREGFLSEKQVTPESIQRQQRCTWQIVLVPKNHWNCFVRLLQFASAEAEMALIGNPNPAKKTVAGTAPKASGGRGPGWLRPSFRQLQPFSDWTWS